MIRAARTTNAANIADLWNWMIRDTLWTFTSREKTTEDVAKLIDARPRHFLVHETEGVFQGFATFGPFRAGPGYRATCEHSILVLPGHHGAGVGRALMEALIAAAQADDFHVMIGAISSENRPALDFHLKMGFEQVGYMPQVGRKAGRWLDLILMQKNLTKRP